MNVLIIKNRQIKGGVSTGGITLPPSRVSGSIKGLTAEGEE